MWVGLLTVALSAAAQAAPPGPPAAKTPAKPPALKPPLPPVCRVTFSFSQRPPSRVWCHLSASGAPFAASNAALEFDPTDPGKLEASASLQANTSWSVSCEEEPHPETVQLGELTASVDTAWQFATPSGAFNVDASCDPPAVTAKLLIHPTGPALKTTGDLKALTVAPDDKAPDIALQLRATQLPSLSEASLALGSPGGGAFGGRSLDTPAPSLVQDTLTLLAEIAVQRAKSRAFNLIQNQLVHFVCDELVVPKHSDLPWAPERPLLPSTCDAVRAITLAQLAEAAPVLSRALDHDLLMLALEGVARSAGAHPGLLLTSVLKEDPTLGALSELQLPDTPLMKCGALSHRLKILLDDVRETGWSKGTAQEEGAALRALAAALNPQAGDPVVAVSEELKPQVDSLETTFAGLKGAVDACDDKNDLTVAKARRLFNQDAKDLSEFRRHLVVTSNDKDLSFIIGQLEAVMGGAILAGHAPTPRALQGMVVALAQHSWSMALLGGNAGCAVQVAFATTATCHAMGASCDARAIGDMLEHPERHFTLASCDAATQLIETYPELPGLVTHALDVVEPPPGTPPDRQAEDALRVAFDVLRIAFRDQPPHARALVEQVEKVSLASMNANPQAAIQAGGALVRQAICDAEPESCLPGGADSRGRTILRAINRTLPVVTALAANSESLRQAQASPEQASALREARKQTLESLIESSTDRTHRGGEAIFSLGTMVGPAVTLFGGNRPSFFNDLSKWSKRSDEITLALPMGFAYQALPEGAGFSGRPRHVMLSVVDLGNFLTTAEDKKPVQWSDFVSLGLQAGWLWAPDPGDLVSFGVDFHYFPAGRLAGHGRFMIYVGYYVPFFDFN